MICGIVHNTEGTGKSGYIMTEFICCLRIKLKDALISYSIISCLLSSRLCRLYHFFNRMHILVLPRDYLLYQKTSLIRFSNCYFSDLNACSAKPAISLFVFFPSWWITRYCGCDSIWQIRLWESDLNRVEATPAHLYDEFPSSVLNPKLKTPSLTMILLGSI